MFNTIKNNIYRILRFTQKFTRTDMVYLTKNGAWLFFDLMVNFVVSFISAILFAKLLNKETFGVYNYIISTINLIGVAHLSGMSTAVTRSVANGFEGSLKSATIAKMKWGLLISLIILIFSGYYFIQGNIILGWSFFIGAIFFPLISSLQLYTAYLSGKKRFNRVAMASIIECIITTGLIIATLIASKSVTLLIFVFYAGNFLVVAGLSKIINSLEKPNKTVDPETINYGAHLSLLRGLGSITNYLDRFLIFHFLGSAQLAIYHFAIALPYKINSVFNIIPNIAFPKLTQPSITEVKKTIGRKLFGYFLICLIIVVLYVLLAKFVYLWFFPQYLSAIRYSQLFAVTLLFAPLSILFTFLQAQALKKEIYLYKISYAFFQIVCLFIFGYFWGIVGVISAKIFAGIFSSLFLLIIFKRLKDPITS